MLYSLPELLYQLGVPRIILESDFLMNSKIKKEHKMDIIDRTKNQHINYTNLKELGIKSGYEDSNFIMFVKELNLLKYKTLVSYNCPNNSDKPNSDSKVNIMVEYLNFIDIFFEASTNSIMLMDTEGKIQYVNPNFETVTGYASEEIKGRSFNILKCWDTENNLHDILWETLNQGKEWHGEIKKKKKNGEVFWDYSTIYPVFDENQSITHYLIVNEDITESKTTQSRTNHSAGSSAQRYLLRKEFLIRISTEIKVNLNIISGYVEILKYLVKDDDYKYSSIYFDAVSKHFQQLLKGVKEFSKEDPSQFNFLEPNNIFRFLKEVQVPVKIILRLIENLKNGFDRNNDIFLFGTFKGIGNLGGRILKITRLINDLSKGEIDEEKYLRRVLEGISENE